MILSHVSPCFGGAVGVFFCETFARSVCVCMQAFAAPGEGVGVVAVVVLSEVLRCVVMRSSSVRFCVCVCVCGLLLPLSSEHLY